MEPANPCVFINDDMVELKQIFVSTTNCGKHRRFTISEAEKRGFVKIDSCSREMDDCRYSKAIEILKNNVRLCISGREC